MSKLICTDRGDHRRVVLLDQQPDDEVDMPMWPAVKVTGRLKGTSLEADMGSDPQWLRCRRCGRNPRLRPEKVRALLAAAAERPGEQLDLSLLRL
jgi:hypothetical protein